MTKRALSLTLAVLLLLAAAIPTAFAVPSLTYVKARLDKSFDVYAGPGSGYRRLGTVGGGGVDRIYGVVDNGWMLLGYQGSSGVYRIGYVEPSAVGHLYDIEGSINTSLTFSDAHTVTIVRDIGMTDDPIINNKSIAQFEEGDAVTLLATLGSNWAYVEGKSLRGFVRIGAVSEFVTPKPSVTAKPTARPTARPTDSPYIPPTGGNSRLASLRHNCTSSGKLSPGAFSPYQYSYLLTMASTVDFVRFTPTAYNQSATITVNGQYVASGAQSQKIYMSDQPQMVAIRVTYGGESSEYTVFLQRRPDTRRTRVSIGFINSFYQSGGDWYINADLATVKYYGENYQSGNLSTYTNTSSSEQYKYAVDPNCIFYYGTMTYPYRATNINDFMSHYAQYGSTLYRIVYIGDKIVAVLPYASDAGTGGMK